MHIDGTLYKYWNSMHVTEFLCFAIGQNGVIVIFYKIHIDNMIKIIILLYWCVLKLRYELKPFSVD